MTKTPEEIELMAEAGRLLASVFTHLDGLKLEGMNTLEINDRVEAFIVDELQARPASKGQYGYGFVLNSSRNAVVCHGVPSRDEVLRGGDIVNLDSDSKGLPAVRVTLKSSTGRDVYAWNYTLPQLNIDQMGKVRFKTRLLAPPEASVSVEVRFTDQHQP